MPQCTTPGQTACFQIGTIAAHVVDRLLESAELSAAPGLDETFERRELDYA
jgi:hypothetical protein